MKGNLPQQAKGMNKLTGGIHSYYIMYSNGRITAGIHDIGLLLNRSAMAPRISNSMDNAPFPGIDLSHQRPEKAERMVSIVPHVSPAH